MQSLLRACVVAQLMARFVGDAFMFGTPARNRMGDQVDPRRDVVVNARGQIRQSQSETAALALGGVLLTALLANRFMVPADQLYDSEGRSDLIAVAAISGFVLNSLSALEVTSRESDVVELEGVGGRGVSPSLLEGPYYQD